jgi:hypothetical protein
MPVRPRVFRAFVRACFVTDDERGVLEVVRADLRSEETEQTAEHGYASPKLLRAIARLDQLLPEGVDLTE